VCVGKIHCKERVGIEVTQAILFVSSNELLIVPSTYLSNYERESDEPNLRFGELAIFYTTPGLLRTPNLVACEGELSKNLSKRSIGFQIASPNML
jgi:hypothetical protein